MKQENVVAHVTKAQAESGLARQQSYHGWRLDILVQTSTCDL